MECHVVCQNLLQPLSAQSNDHFMIVAHFLHAPQNRFFKIYLLIIRKSLLFYFGGVKITSK